MPAEIITGPMASPSRPSVKLTPLLVATITNVANLRIKECDRIRAAATELQRLGIAVEEGDDFLVIQPDGCNIAPARIETYDDHRVAMSFGLLRLLYDGIEIEDPACVAKSFPGFWDELARFVEHHEP